MIKNNKFLFALIFFTVLFCFAIAVDIFPFLRGPAPYPPDWQWDYLFVNTINKLWLPLIVIGLLLSFFIKHEYIEKKYKTWQWLLFLVVGSFLFQITVLYFSRSGIFVLFHRIVNPDLNGYFTAALSIYNLSDFLKNFNNTVLLLPQHAQGHPPGAILFFLFINKIFSFFPYLFSFLDNIHPERSDVLILWNSLPSYQKASALFSGFFIPFLSSLTLIPLHFLVKLLYDKQIALKTTFLYIFIPSVVLFIPINDVFLSLFTVTTLLFFIKGLYQKNSKLVFLSGGVLSMGIFFSLSLLPIVFFLGVFTLISWLQNKIQFVFSVKAGIYFLVGFLLLPIILFLFFQFNFWEVSKTLMSGLPEDRKYNVWIWFNLSDFLIFAGIPVTIMFFTAWRKTVQLLLKKGYKTIDPILVSFTFMLLLLNFSGSVRGEVARIWLSFYPLLIIPLINYIKPQKQTLFMIILLQVIQILVMQEFWVMLW